MCRVMSVGFLVCIFAGALVADENERVIVAGADKAVVHQSGLCYCEDSMEVGAGNHVLVRFPAEIETCSVSVMTGDCSVDNVFLKEEVVCIETTDKEYRTVIQKKRVGYVCDFVSPSAARPDKLPIVVRYAIQGITWQPYLTVEVGGGDQITLSLRAMLSNQGDDLRDCDLMLASSAGLRSLESHTQQRWASYEARPETGNFCSADILYRIGKRDVTKGSQFVVPLLSGKTSFETKYEWDTDSRERVRMILMFRNPFDTALCGSSYTLLRNGVPMVRGVSEWISLGETAEIKAEIEPAIEVKRSIVTTEDEKKNPLPFNHAISFTVRNRMKEEARLEVRFRKKTGSHRTQYHFKREPDRRPGDLFIWDLKIPVGGTEVVAFDFDSDVARFPEYELYEDAQYGK